MAITNHIYVQCTGFVHHGIDCGDGTVIHYEVDQIVQIPIDTFCDGKQYQVKPYAHCDSDDVVIKRAESRLGESEYNLLFNNCEHFAVWCKTGQHKSEQVKNVGTSAGGASASGAAVAGSIGIVGATGAAVGLSGAGIMSGLAAVGSIVGGGMAAGVAITVAAPAVASIGFGAYSIWKWVSEKK
jgi:Lecithin retinol acyltransferase